MIIALYVAVMLVTAGFSFGAIQIRIATAIYTLSYLFPFLVFPLGLANGLSNFLFGGLGVIDVAGGFIVGIITAGLIALIRKYRLPVYLVALPIIFVPGLVIPTYLSGLLGVPYMPLAISVTSGQIIPGIVGAVLAATLEKRKEFSYGRS
jgi:uncharacterized membrane protein